jgi:hypothetical protein
LNFWDAVPVESYPARLCTVGETLLLNSPDLSPVSPKVVRFPTVFTEPRLREILGTAASAASDASYSLLEVEAAALALDAAAVYKKRVLLVPRREHSFSERDVRRILMSRDPADGKDAVGVSGAVPLPVFPTETVRPSLVPAAREVMSPLYPAADSLLGAVEKCLLAPRGDSLDESLKTIQQTIFERVMPEMHTSIE